MYLRSSRCLIARSSFQCCDWFSQNFSYSLTDRRNSPIPQVSSPHKDSVRRVRIDARVRTASANGDFSNQTSRSHFWSALSRMNVLLLIEEIESSSKFWPHE